MASSLRGSRVHGTGQPLSALVTAATISSTVTTPSPLASTAGQLLRLSLPSAMATPRTISSMVTVPSPLQSPVHGSADAAAKVVVVTWKAPAPLFSRTVTYQAPARGALISQEPKGVGPASAQSKICVVGALPARANRSKSLIWLSKPEPLPIWPLSPMRNTAVPSGTSNWRCASAPLALSSPPAAVVAVSALPTAGRSQLSVPRSVPAVASIHARFTNTSLSKALSGARHVLLWPPEVTPATTGPAPKSINSGPPESPSHELAPVPENSQQMWVSFGMSSGHSAVVTVPVRLMPLSSVLPRPVAVVPKPTMVPAVPTPGRCATFKGLGAMPVTESPRVTTATSPRTANW